MSSGEMINPVGGSPEQGNDSTALDIMSNSSDSKNLTDGERFFLGMWFIFKAGARTMEGLVHLDYMHKFYPDVVKFVDSEGCNALHGAAYGGQIETCELLVGWLKKAGVELGLKSYHGHYTAMHYAASQGHVEVVKVLLNHGMSAEARDDIGRCPHMHAGIQGHMDVLEHFLDLRDDTGDRTIDIDDVDTFGNTVLHWAVVKGRPGVTAMLMRRGADFYRTGYDCKNPQQLAIPRKKVASFLKQWETDCAHCHKMAQGLPPDSAEKQQEEKARKGPWTCFDSLRARCLKHKPDGQAAHRANVYDVFRGQNGETLLMTAAKNDNYDVVLNLLQRGANFEAEDKFGRTALYCAASSNSDKNLKCFKQMVLRTRLGMPLCPPADHSSSTSWKRGTLEFEPEDTYQPPEALLPTFVRDDAGANARALYRYAPLRVRAKEALAALQKTTKVGKTLEDVIKEDVSTNEKKATHKAKMEYLAAETEALTLIVNAVDAGVDSAGLQFVFDFLHELNLFSYLRSFLKEGFTSKDSLKYIQDDDFIQMGHQAAQYRKVTQKINTWRHPLPEVPAMTGVTTVEELLLAHGLKSADYHNKFKAGFEKDGFETLESLECLRFEDLVKYGIPRAQCHSINKWHDYEAQKATWPWKNASATPNRADHADEVLQGISSSIELTPVPPAAEEGNTIGGENPLTDAEPH